MYKRQNPIIGYSASPQKDWLKRLCNAVREDVYKRQVLHLNKQNLVIKYNGKEERITPDLLNGINESPSEYAILVENWSATKATYITALEGVFRKDCLLYTSRNWGTGKSEVVAIRVE